MALGSAVALHEAELRADFQRFYGLNLDDMGRSYSVHHAACIAAHMPQGSALYASIDPSSEWTASDHLLSLIEYDIRSLAWGLSGGRKSKSPKPKRIEPPSASRKTDYSRSDMDEIADALGIPEDRR